jgi:hypothetical protein
VRFCAIDMGVGACVICAALLLRAASPALPLRTPVYVDAASGSDANDGASLTSAFASLKHAAAVATPNSAIYVLNGTYSNTNYGLGRERNGAAATLSGVDNVVLTALPGHMPVVAFDGWAASWRTA